MRARQKTSLLTVVLLGSMLATGAILALASGTPAIDWSIIGGGGGHLEQGIYSLDNTVGQSAVGADSGGIFDLCAGFWCGAAGVEYSIYLPVVMRSFP